MGCGAAGGPGTSSKKTAILDFNQNEKEEKINDQKTARIKKCLILVL